jgi:3-hydroxyacyl-[acyl-carrier-protein] dehydratase
MSETQSTPETAPTAAKRTMDIVEIMSILPHRFPMLLIDRVIELEPRKRIVALKNVTANEPHFTGHFPDYPIMPGVMTIEAMAQAAGALLLGEFSAVEREQRLMVFTGIDSARFRKPVLPGDQVLIEVTVLNWRSTIVKLKGVATVDGAVVSDATFTAALIPRARAAKEGGKA